MLELKNKCDFTSVFSGPKKLIGNTVSRYPASEMAYFRSDYSNDKWWTTWKKFEDRPVDPILAEMAEFSEELFRLPAFADLETLKGFCQQNAEATSASYEWNLYSETEHFHVWMRVNTTPRDNNLYVHYYLKET